MRDWRLGGAGRRSESQPWLKAGQAFRLRPLAESVSHSGGGIPGCIFPMGWVSEGASHSERLFWDAVSG